MAVCGAGQDLVTAERGTEYAVRDAQVERVDPLGGEYDDTVSGHGWIPSKDGDQAMVLDPSGDDA